MKRKAEDVDLPATNGTHKRRATARREARVNFRSGLFDSQVIDQHRIEYAQSSPYKHGVVTGLIEDSLLRSVRSEILENIAFTLKETDIYRILQSGDLVNLDALPKDVAAKLPSLLKLRNALYSNDFRQWLSAVTGAGLLSGSKTDMAVNLYTPGCHLLCHDDVIGSRRLSYILYLTDPDKPWRVEWGGALRLYPTDNIKDTTGKKYKVPSSEWSKSIPPAWNQLSFFAVQPGESFHDVEEVYEHIDGDAKGDGRMAISGWFHIPQEGEQGYDPGLEERLAEQSSLQQLQGKADQLDTPSDLWHEPIDSYPSNDSGPSSDDSVELSEAELDLLVQFITPEFLTPDTVEKLNEIFTEESSVAVDNFLNSKFAERLRRHLQDDQSAASGFITSRPPYKHRYQFKATKPRFSAAVTSEVNDDPVDLVLNKLLHSLAFRKWLTLVTGLTLQKCSVLARRFRRGMDYQLAQSYHGEDPQLEYCLCITPGAGWDNGGEDSGENGVGSNGTRDHRDSKDVDVGGYELYMAGDDDDDDGEGSHDGVEIPAKPDPQTGAGNRRNASRKKADPAVYQAAGGEEDDGILVVNPARWNHLSIVLRDQATLRFVKYVSQRAPGDRWDFFGKVEVEPDDEASDASE